VLCPYHHSFGICSKPQTSRQQPRNELHPEEWRVWNNRRLGRLTLHWSTTTYSPRTTEPICCMASASTDSLRSTARWCQRSVSTGVTRRLLHAAVTITKQLTRNSIILYRRRFDGNSKNRWQMATENAVYYRKKENLPSSPSRARLLCIFVIWLNPLTNVQKWREVRPIDQISEELSFVSFVNSS